MDGDGEYSYTGYSESTQAEIEDNRAAYTGDDEEFSYTGYSADSSESPEAVYVDNGEELSYTSVVEADGFAEEHTERISSYGDFIVEEFSAEQNAARVANVTKMSKNAASYLLAAVYLVLGVLCVSITGIITEVLPYIVGALMIVVGIVRFIIAIIHKEYKDLKTNQTATSFLVAALGVMIILQEIDATNDSAIMLISVVWGILGLFEGAHAFNHALKRISNSERCGYYLIKGLLECVVAFMLLYRPDSHEIHHFHIIVFGANLILDALIMIPPVKKFLSMK